MPTKHVGKELLAVRARHTAFPDQLGWRNCMEEGMGMGLAMGMGVGMGIRIEMRMGANAVPAERPPRKKDFLWSLPFPHQGMTPDKG